MKEKFSFIFKCDVFFSAIALLLSLPFFKWIRIDEVQKSYSAFDILSYVQDSGHGILGLYGMILLILAIASIYFHVVSLGKIIFKKKGKNGNLSLYLSAKTTMIFEFFFTGALIGYGFFANAKVDTAGMHISPVIYILFVLSILFYVIVKIKEAEERKIYREHGILREIQKNWVLFLMLLPTFIFFMINCYLPTLGVYYAFTSFNFRDGLWASPFVGWKNFEFLAGADLFKLTRNTILYNIVFIFLGNILQIFFAILVSQVTVKWFKKTSQTLMFMPYFVSFVILKVLVYNIFEYEYGLVNNIITSMGGDKIDFYNTPSYWPVLITLFYIWKNIGYGMVVYLATITGIDSEMYEAAKVDGANIFQQIWYITLPQIKPTFIILLLYALGSIMKGQFELFYQMIGNNGVLYNVTDILDTYVYRIALTQPMSIGLGTAAGLYQSLFGFVIVVGVNWLVKRKNPEYALF